jgi:uncharacterized membrane protein
MNPDQERTSSLWSSLARKSRRGLGRFGAWLREALRRYFVAGILFFAPIGITLWAIASIVVWLDNLLLPPLLKLAIPGLEEPPRLPLIGTLFTLLVIIFLGVIAVHLFGGEFARAWERLLSRVPVARNIYAGVKQLFEAIFRSDQRSRFRRVVLIQYPRPGIYALAFTTGPAHGRVAGLVDRAMVNCFLPTTPNPTSGFYLLVPEEDVVEVNLSVEEAFKLVMSAGLVAPEGDRARSEPPTGPIPLRK